MEELWKPVKDYEGLYEVSNLGRVRSLPRMTKCKRRYAEVNVTFPGKILKPGINKKGYKFVVLCREGERKIVTVHRLVATVFIENKLGKPQVNHIDENKLNNSTENLEWVTHLENSRHGTRGARIAKANTGNPLTSRPIFQYTFEGELVATYASPRVAEEKTGISRHSITSALYNNTHRLKGYLWKFE